ncbi:MAG: hypothetical protein NUW37_14275 [Planctomycetes bacterium]|nr:hypothetical protein [Planctomycetota bacterium]
MNTDEYAFLSSEITELESLLAEIPPEDVIDRKSLESRLRKVRKEIEGVRKDRLTHRAKLYFRGKPVFGSHGMSADFAAKATNAFNDAVVAVAAAFLDGFKETGPFPEKRRNNLVLTGTAVGSFGLVFETPENDDPQLDLFPEQTSTERAIEQIQNLLQKSIEGSDDELTNLVDEIHPRAAKKVAAFLSVIAGQDAWFAMEFKDKPLRFDSVEQIKVVSERLGSDNIFETEETIRGEFQGARVVSLDFDFKRSDNDEIIKGKIGKHFSNPGILNSEYFSKPVTAKFHLVRVGTGRPSYRLESAEDIASI